MELAYTAFQQVLTMVVLIIIGIICAKIGMIDDETNKKLSNLLLMLVNPLLIFLSYQRHFAAVMLKGLLWAVFLSTLSFGISILGASIIYKDRQGKNYAIEKFGTVYSNAGFLGIPLVNGVFGSEGVFYLTGYLTVFFIFFWSHGLIVMSGKRDFTAIRKAFLSPAMISIFLGLAFFIFRISLPEVIHKPLSLLGNINTPLAMLVAGVSIANTNVKEVLKDKRIYGVCIVRLLILPALTIVSFMPFRASNIVVGTVAIAASCPVAANIIMLAYRYERENVYAAQIFAATTIVSLVTIPFILLWL
jgi:Predicted permeases